MENLSQDIRFAVRSLLKTPRLTLAAVACIAIGIGATVSVLTLINGFLLGAGPYPGADRLVRVWSTTDPETPRWDISYLDYQDVKQQSQSFEALEAALRARFGARTEDGTQRLRGEAVTTGYFDLLGMKPAVGRLFSADEYQADAAPVMLISDRLWREDFGADPNVQGETLLARSVWAPPDAPEVPFTIVGVLPAGFTGSIEDDVADFWLPVEQFEPRAFLSDRTQEYAWLLGRLKAGVSFEAAAEEVAQLGVSLNEAYPERGDGKFQLWLEPFAENWRSEIRQGLYLLLAASALLLLIACTNIANLLLARLARRESELSLRRILGARSGRILRQLLTESLMLAVTGGAIGLLLAHWGIRGYLRVANFEVPEYVDVSLDLRLVVLAVLLTAGTGVLFGVLPAWVGSRVAPAQQVRETGRGSMTGRRQARFGRWLVIGEVALTFMLLVSAGLMLRSYQQLANVDVGYRTDNFQRMSVTLNRVDMPAPPDWNTFADEARRTLEARSDVEAVTTVAGMLPPFEDFPADVQLPDAEEPLRGVTRHSIDPYFFDTLDIGVLFGRSVRDSDAAGSTRVAVLSRSLARRLTGGDAVDMLSQEMRFVMNPRTGDLSPPFTVVGVVEDVKWAGPRTERANPYDIYLSRYQMPMFVLSFGVATNVDPRSIDLSLRKEVGRLAPTSPVHWVSNMEQELADAYADSRFYASLFGVYSACAVLLAIIGIYGLLSYSVVSRYGELGMRMAIGAQGGDILSLVLLQGLRTVGIGLLLGLVGAFATARLLSSQLYGITVRDPWTFGAVLGGLLLLSLIACLLPALRATRVDPVNALRQD